MKPAKVWTCQYHQIVVNVETHDEDAETYVGDRCPQCWTEWQALRSVDQLTAQERADEFEHWLNHDQLTVPWSDFKERLLALLGCGIWTHELLSSNQSLLLAEIRGKIPAPQFVDEIIARLPEHLQDSAITIDLDDFSAAPPTEPSLN